MCTAKLYRKLKTFALFRHSPKLNYYSGIKLPEKKANISKIQFVY